MSTRLSGCEPVHDPVLRSRAGKDTNPTVPKILIIDDEEEVRALLRKALEKQGYEVEEAADGSQGTRLLSQRPFDLVIVDLFMPKKDGMQTIIDVRQGQPDVKVVAISGGGLTGNLELLTHAQTLGAECSFAKPFNLNELLDTVCDLIGPPP